MAEQRTPRLTNPMHTMDLIEARWERVLNSAQDAIIGIRPDGNVVLFNEAAERLFGYRAEEAIGQNVQITYRY